MVELCKLIFLKAMFTMLLRGFVNCTIHLSRCIYMFICIHTCIRRPNSEVNKQNFSEHFTSSICFMLVDCYYILQILSVWKMAEHDELLDYDEEQEEPVVDGVADVGAKKEVKGTYVSIHSSGFRDFLLKPELLRAIVDCGFEHPSEGNTCCETLLKNT